MKKWYAVYTRSRAEKKLYTELNSRNIQAYLPLIRKLKQWSDRRKWVEEVLFRGYVFVRIAPEEHKQVLELPYAVSFISFEGKAAEIPEVQIRAIQTFLDTPHLIEEISQDIDTGKKVEVTSGPLKGLTGELTKKHKKHRVMVEIDGMTQKILLEIPLNKLREIK